MSVLTLQTAIFSTPHALIICDIRWQFSMGNRPSRVFLSSKIIRADSVNIRQINIELDLYPSDKIINCLKGGSIDEFEYWLYAA